MKAEAKRLRKQGLNYTEIAKRFGVSRSTACRWCNPATHERSKLAAREWKRRNPEAVRDEARKKRERRWRKQNPNAKSKPARACECERPWPQKEERPFEITCLKCSREIA